MNNEEFLETFKENLKDWLGVLDEQSVSNPMLKGNLVGNIQRGLCPAFIFCLTLRLDTDLCEDNIYHLISYTREQAHHYKSLIQAENWASVSRAMIDIVEEMIT